MVPPGARVLDVGCGDGDAAAPARARQAASTGAASRSRQRGVNRMRGARPVGDPGRRRHRPRPLPRPRLRLRDPVARPSRRPAARGACSSSCCASAKRAIGVVSQFRPLAGAHAAAVRRPHAAHRQSAGPLVRHAEHPSLHHQRLSSICAGMPAHKVERAVALNAYGSQARRLHAAVRAESVRRAGGVPAEPAELGPGRFVSSPAAPAAARGSLSRPRRV